MPLKTDLLNRIKKRGMGYIFFPSDFPTIGAYNNVLQALHLLAKERTVIRLGKGIYYYPKTDPELGILLPSLEQIAYAVAKRDGVKIRPTGARALNELGLSTQIPMKVVFLTSGRSKTLHIGKNTIDFKAEKGRRLQFKKNALGKLLLGLETLSEEMIDGAMLDRAEKIIAGFTAEEIRVEAKKASPWIRNLLVNVEKKAHAVLARTNPGEKNRDH